MKNTFKALAAVLVLIILNSKGLIALAVYQEPGMTLSEVLQDTAIFDYDPVKLISLAVLKNVDYTKIMVNDQNIIDSLNAKQQQEFNFSESTIKAYKDAIDKAKTGLQNDWDTQVILNYMTEAYDLYNKHIADVLNITSTEDDIVNAIESFIAQTQVTTADLGDISEELMLLLTGQRLISIDTSEPIQTKNRQGEDITIYQAEQTTWVISNGVVSNIFTGQVLDITENSITVYVGTENNKITMTYTSLSDFTLARELNVGDTVEKGEHLLNSNVIKLELKFNDTYIDILKLLGTTGRLFISDYMINASEAYNKNRSAYIEDWMRRK